MGKNSSKYFKNTISILLKLVKKILFYLKNVVFTLEKEEMDVNSTT